MDEVRYLCRGVLTYGVQKYLAIRAREVLRTVVIHRRGEKSVLDMKGTNAPTYDL